MASVKDLTDEQLLAQATSFRKTVGNPFASRDMEAKAFKALKPVEREIARRGL